MKNTNYRVVKKRTAYQVTAIILAIVAILTLYSVALHRSLMQVGAQQIGVDGQAIAGAVAQNIMADIGAYKTQQDSLDPQSEYYQRMQRYMAQIVQSSDAVYVFTERRVSEDSVESILHSEPAGDLPQSLPGTAFPSDDQREATLTGGRPSHSELYEDPLQGQLINAYSPIYDSDGSIIGLAGVSVSALPFAASLFNTYMKVGFFSVMVLSVLTAFLVKISPDIYSMAFRDELTGAYNKRYLKRFLSRWVKRSKRTGIPVSILHIDVDRLSDINAQYGRDFGNQVLQYFSKRVINTLRGTDCYARFGGEEFLVVLPGTVADMAGRIGERIRKIAEKNDIYNITKQLGIKATVSIGVAQLDHRTNDINKMLREAEQALGVAKQQRNSVAVHSKGEALIVCPEAKKVS